MSVRQSWAFSLDGHTFYVLGDVEEGTLLFDLSTGQWCIWKVGSYGFFNMRRGTVWRGRVIGAAENSNRLVTLSGQKGYDEGDVGKPIERVATGYQPMRGKDSVRVGALRLTCDVSEQGTVTMRFSDDNGATWSTPRQVELKVGMERVAWRSLGRIRAPGRLVEIADAGGPVRLDGLDADLDVSEQ